MKNNLSLTKSEYSVLETLWNCNESLSRRDIMEQTVNRTWKENYLTTIINSLLKKGVIEVDGYKQYANILSRTFKPSITPTEYSKIKFEQSHIYKKDKKKALSSLLSAFIDQESDANILEELKAKITERENELNKD